MSGFAGASGISVRQERTILCLLSETTVPAAAAKAQVAESTLRRWLNQPAFVAAYRRARLASYQETLRLLRRAGNAAVVVLVSVMQDRSVAPASRIRAAEIVLDHDRRGLEIEDIESRLAELEELVKEQTP